MSASQQQNPADKIEPSMLPFDPAQLMAVRVSQAEFARICRVSRQAVSEWVRKGKISVFPDGKIDPHAAARQVFERTDPARLRARVFRGAVVSLDRLRQRVAELESQLAAERDCRGRLTIHKDDLARMDVELVETFVERFDDLVSANQRGELQAAIEQITSWCLWRASAENEEEEAADLLVAVGEEGKGLPSPSSGDLFAASGGAVGAADDERNS